MDSGITAITIPSGNDSIATVKSKLTGYFGSVSPIEMGLDDFNLMIMNVNDRKLRNAWISNNGVITEDIDRSRDLMRSYRTPVFNLLDICALKESRKPNGNLTNVDIKTQILRDIPDRPEFKESNILAFKNIVDEIFTVSDFANSLLTS